MGYYDRIITVGTDILFTDMKKDIRDFCTDHFIVIQEEFIGARDVKHFCNGDFIIWANNKECLKQLEEMDSKYVDTQQAISHFQ